MLTEVISTDSSYQLKLFFELGNPCFSDTFELQNMLYYAIKHNAAQCADFLLSNVGREHGLHLKETLFYRDKSGGSRGIRPILHLAAEISGKETMKVLLKYFQDRVKEWDRKGMTAVHYAVETRNIGTLEALAAHGAPLYSVDFNRRSPVRIAVEKRYWDAVCVLIKYRADMSTFSDNGDTPLHDAVWRYNYGMVEELLKSWPDIDIENDHGATPLIYAVRKNNMKFIRLLVEHGADIHHANKNGETPLSLAQVEAAEFLKAYGEREETEGAGIQ